MIMKPSQFKVGDRYVRMMYFERHPGPHKWARHCVKTEDGRWALELGGEIESIKKHKIPNTYTDAIRGETYKLPNAGRLVWNIIFVDGTEIFREHPARPPEDSLMSNNKVFLLERKSDG